MSPLGARRYFARDMPATQTFMPSPATPDAGDDADLLAATREGSVEAFAALVGRYQNLVCAIAFSKTGDRRISEDVAQDTFLAAWKQRETIRQPERLRSWLCSTARNLANKSRRVARVEQLSDPEALERDPAQRPSPLDAVIDREEEKTVWDALAALPETYREPLVLFYREDRSIREVAAGLGLSEDATKKRLSRGRQALREGVRDVVERTLEAGRPHAAFTAGVVALVGSVAVPQSAAAAEAVRAAGGSSKSLWLGLSLVGLVGSILGFALLWRPAPTPPEPPVDGTAVGPSADETLVNALHEQRRSVASPPAGPCEFLGTVVDDNDDPIEGAVVSVGSPATDEWDLGAIEVRDDGTWSAGPLPAGEHALSVTAVGYLPSTSVRRCADDPTLVIETRLSPGGTRVRGRIEDIAGGVVADATVSLRPTVDPSGTVSAISDDDGVYEISVRPDRYTIVVRHPDYVVDGRRMVISGDAATEDFRVLPAASIEGTVVDEHGEPVANAKVRLHSSIGRLGQQRSAFAAVSGAMRPVRSDDDGHFRIGGLASGEVQLQASTDSLATRRPASTNLAMAESKSGVIIELAEAFEVSGFVVDEDRPTRGLAEADVVLVPNGTLLGSTRVTTDATGYFALGGIASGDYRVFLGGQSAARQRLAEPLHVSDSDRRDLVLRARPGREIRGQADPPGRVAVRLELDPEGGGNADVARRTLTAMSSASVSEMGEFLFPAVADGQYIVVAGSLHDEGRTRVTVAGASVQDIAVEMKPLETIEGTVVDDAGRVVAGVLVSGALRDAPAGASTFGLTDRTDDEGRFVLLGARQAGYALTVLDGHGTRPWADREEAEAYEPLAVDVGPDLRSLTLTVATGTTTVSGLAVDPSGAPIADARVQVRPVGGSPMSHLRPPAVGLTDEDGAFSFEGLFGKSFMVTAIGPRGSMQAVPEFTEGEEVLTLSLAPMSSIQATVEHDGKPVEEYEVEVYGGPSLVAGFRIGKHEGAFEVPDLISGTYSVTVRSGDNCARAVVEVGPEPRTSAHFELDTAPQIRGQVVRANGDPATDAHFVLFADDKGSLDPSWNYDRRPVQPDGSFEIGDMMPGRWNAMVRTDEGGVNGTAFFEFELDPGQELDLGTIALGARFPLRDPPFMDHSPDLGIRFFVGPEAPDAEALRRVDEADEPRSVIETQGARLWIASVEPDSPAEAAGLRAGDIVLTVGRTEVGVDRPALQAMISLSQRWRSRGRSVDWTVERDGSRSVIAVLLPRRGG